MIIFLLTVTGGMSGPHWRPTPIPRQTWPTDSPPWQPRQIAKGSHDTQNIRLIAWITLFLTVPIVQVLFCYCSRRRRIVPSDEKRLIQNVEDTDDSDFQDWAFVRRDNQPL
jgi:hypothetical protein